MQCAKCSLDAYGATFCPSCARAMHDDGSSRQEVEEARAEQGGVDMAATLAALVELASDAFDEGTQDGEGRKVEDLDLSDRWMRSSARRRLLEILTDEVRAMMEVKP